MFAAIMCLTNVGIYLFIYLFLAANEYPYSSGVLRIIRVLIIGRNVQPNCGLDRNWAKHVCS